MRTTVKEADLSSLDIESLDIGLLAETQIVEFISRNEMSLSRLVNEILMRQGYRTSISLFGGDGSAAILAEGGRDPFGFIVSRLAVLVQTDIGPADLDVTDLERFIALSGASNGLFVSWTGFTASAQKEVCRLFHQAKFWNIGQVVEMLSANYSTLSNSLKSDLRLRKVWVLERD